MSYRLRIDRIDGKAVLAVAPLPQPERTLDRAIGV